MSQLHYVFNLLNPTP